MNARKKLNTAYAQGAVLIATVLGLMTGSWPIFFLSAASLLVTALHVGNIRPRRRG